MEDGVFCGPDGRKHQPRALHPSLIPAEDIANVVDDGATRRFVPMVGKSSLQTVADLRLLRGVDVAIVEADVLDAPLGVYG